MSDPFPSPAVLTGRPRRRRWRYVVGLLLLLVLVGLGLYVYYSVVAERELTAVLAETENSDPRWRLADVEADRASVPDAQNSALVAMAARQLLPENWPAWEDSSPTAGSHPDDILKRRSLEQSFQYLEPQQPLSEEEIEALRVELHRAEPALAEARKLAELPQGRYPITYTATWIDTEAPCSHYTRQVAHLLDCDVLLRAHDGDTDGALASCKAILNDARSVGDEPWLVSQLVRVACRVIGVNKVERVLAQGEPSEASLTQLQRLLEQEEPEPLMLFAARGERAGEDTLLEAMQTGKFQVSGTVIEEAIKGPSNDWKDLPPEVQLALLRVPPFVKRERAAMLRYMNRLIEAAMLPAEQQMTALQELETAARQEPILVRLLAPTITKVAEACRRSRVQLRCALLATAAERYRKARGQWPGTLEALKEGGFLREVPTDLYDGQPLRLRRLDEGLVVYSVGPDGQDNGGNLDRKNPITPGSDLGFRLWDAAKRRQPPVPPSDAPGPPASRRPRGGPPGGAGK